MTSRSLVALETTALSKRFGGIVATDNVTFTLERGARQALIGPNGAGKTTFVNLLTGVLAPSAGTVRLAGEDITRLRPEARVRRGLVRTFQINQLFQSLTPLETLALAVGERLRAAVASHAFPLATPGQITISTGIAQFPEDGSDVTTLIEAADRTLYAAKRNGRNRVEGGLSEAA